MHDVICYTDGGCAPTNPGIGGWGIIMTCPDLGIRKDMSGGVTLTTNNRMELTAAIKALESVNANRVSSITICTDSKYVTEAFNQRWIYGWVNSNWKNGNLLNLDLWQHLYTLTQKLMQTVTIKFVWVKGHNGHEMNEAVDKLCAVGRASATESDPGYNPPKKQPNQTELAL